LREKGIKEKRAGMCVWGFGRAFPEAIRIVWSKELECKPSLEREQRQGSFGL